MSARFPLIRRSALDLLSMDHPKPLSRKAGSFLGQCVVDPAPLSDAQAEWLATLLERAGLPPLAETRHEA